MTTFNCTGNIFDTSEDIPDEVLEQYDSAAEAFLEHEWGEPPDTAPWEELRDFHKYPSSRHLPFSHVGDEDRCSLDRLDE